MVDIPKPKANDSIASSYAYHLTIYFQYLSINRLDKSTPKSAATLLAPFNPHVFLIGSLLPLVTNLKFLWVISDYLMTFGLHVKEVIDGGSRTPSGLSLAPSSDSEGVHLYLF